MLLINRRRDIPIILRRRRNTTKKDETTDNSKNKKKQHKIKMKMILLIFVLLTDDRSIFTKFRHNLAKLSDEIINVTSKKIIPNSEIIFPLIYRFYTLYFRGHIIFIVFC